MIADAKQLSNPFSTGGGGAIFESRVQAAFVALMLAKGVCPCLPSWQIFKVKLQGKHSGFSTDDVIVYARHEASKREAKLIAQIKHAPSITKKDTQFADAIHSAWRDFQNLAVFEYGYDAIALITGPLSASHTYDVREMLEMARTADDSTDFFEKVQLAKFSSAGKRAKLEVFQHHLIRANDGKAPDNDSTWKFLKSFHLLGYDLDVRTGVSVSLLQSLIGTASTDDVEKVWLRIVDEVQSRNPRAGVMSLENLPQEMRDYFRIKLPPQMPSIAVTPIRETIAAALLGAWDENAVGDKIMIEEFTGMTFASWQDKIREVWLNSPGTFEQKGGEWRVLDLQALWDLEGPRISDALLDQFRSVAVKILREKDPVLELEPEKRLAVSMNRKVGAYSGRLRKGIAEALALLGVRGSSLSTCSTGKAESTALLAVRQILEGSDWDLWASLNDVLPLLAEASPEAFIDGVETALNSRNGVFLKVFALERPSFEGRTYMTGLLWGLETLAWHPNYLIPVCRLLADLAALDPGGNWTNRPGNSLNAILLPWFPQTCAATDKRHAAVRLVVKQQTAVGWKLILSLLPVAHSVSTGNHKPMWRPFISEDRKEEVSQSQYWEDVLVYGQIAIEMADSDPEKLVKLVERYFRLPFEIRDSLRARLGSERIQSLDEPNRFQLWSALTRLTNNHRKFAKHENWQVPEGSLHELEAIADKLSPVAPAVRHKRLFQSFHGDLYEEEGNWQQQEQQLLLRQQDAVREIIAKGGVTLLLQFALETQDSWRIGFVYGSLSELAQDAAVLPSLLQSEQKPLLQFAGGYVCGRYDSLGFTWIDSLQLDSWINSAKGQFFSFLPFQEQTWTRVANAMGNDAGDYWRKTSAIPKRGEQGIDKALEKLIFYGRADVAIHCMHIMLHSDNSLPSDFAIKALDSFKEGNNVNSLEIGELIRHLHNTPSVAAGEVERIEWKYLSLLDDFHHAQPIALSRRMAKDPDFFCKIIRMIFRSTKGDEEVEQSEEIKQRAESVYTLLEEWHIPPGAFQDDSFDPEALASWIQEVKTKSIQSGHWDVAAGKIGAVLFYAPRDETGIWIDPVCSVLDEKDHVRMRRGLTTKIFNSRGVFTPDGGITELKLAEEWESKGSLAENRGFSYLGQDLKRLGNSYRSDAEREAKNKSFEED